MKKKAFKKAKKAFKKEQRQFRKNNKLLLAFFPSITKMLKPELKRIKKEDPKEGNRLDQIYTLTSTIGTIHDTLCKSKNSEFAKVKKEKQKWNTQPGTAADMAAFMANQNAGGVVQGQEGQGQWTAVAPETPTNSNMARFQQTTN